MRITRHQIPPFRARVQLSHAAIRKAALEAIVITLEIISMISYFRAYYNFTKTSSFSLLRLALRTSEKEDVTFAAMCAFHKRASIVGRAGLAACVTVLWVHATLL